MERNVNEEEDSETDDCNLLPKSIIKQGSTEVLNDAVNKENSKCNHFSIRAYVAEIRRKDWKICWPFHSFGDDEEPNDKAAIAEKFCEGQEACFKTSMDMDSYEYMPLIDLLRREKFVNFISKVRHDVLALGEYDNKLASTVDEEMSEPTVCKMKDAQCLNEESVIKDAETSSLDFEGSRLDGAGNSDLGTLNIDEFEIGNKNSSCTSNCSTEISRKEGDVDIAVNIDKMCEHGKELITNYSQKPESESVEDEVLHSRARCTANLFSLKSNQNDEFEDADVINDQDHSIRNMKCRKPQKIRLLADILKKDISGASSGPSDSSEIVHADNINSKVTHTEAANESDDFTLDTLFRSQKAVQAHIDNGTTYKKKRKSLHVGTGSEDSQFHDSNGEKNYIKSVINHSASVNNEFATVNSDVDFKSCLEETRIDELVFKTKKRHRKSSTEVRQSSSKTWQEKLHQELQLMSRDVVNKETGIGTVQFNLAKDGPTETGFNPPKTYLGGQTCDHKRTFGMKGSSDKGSLMPPHKGVPTEEQVTVSKDVEICSYIAESYSGRDSPCCMRNEKDSLRKQKDSSSPYNYGNDIDAQAHLKVATHQSSERANKVCDLEALDDIHMEIVKLLADNRRERRLLEAEQRSRTAHDVNNAHHFHEAKGYLPLSYSQENHSNKNQFAEAGSNSKFATSSHKVQSRKFDVKISNKIDTETPCACVQKKIGKCPKPAGSSNIFRSSRASFDTSKTMLFAKEFSLPQNNYCEETPSVIDGINRVSGAYALPFSAELSTKFTIGRAVEHFPSVKKDSESWKVAKSKNSSAPMKATNNGLPSGNKSLRNNHQSYSINSLDKGFSRAPNTMMFPLDSHLVKNGTFDIEVNKKAGIARAVKGSCRSEICAVNRNPADFSIPGVGNKFMRRGGDFKRRVKKFKTGVDVA